MKLIPLACRSVAIAAAIAFAPAARADAPQETPPKNALDQLDRIVAFQKQLDEAMKANDPQKLIELLGKMQQIAPLERGAPAVQFQFPPRRVEQERPKSDLRQQYEKQLREFAESIDKLKDDKEAREGIEKARDEYKKAMEAELKKADAAQPQSFPLFVPGRVRRVDDLPFDQLLPFADLGFIVPRVGRGDGAPPRLGVQLEKPSAVLSEQLDISADRGLVLVGVLPGTPAEKAGLKKNDILLQWAGKDLSSDVEGFQAMIAAAKIGEKFDAVVLRKGKKEAIKGIELPNAKRGVD